MSRSRPACRAISAERMKRKFTRIDQLKAKLRAAEADLDQAIGQYARARGCAYLRPEAVRLEVGA